MIIKVCGITNLGDALDAIELGVDVLGFNFFPDSPRFITPADAAAIVEEIPDAIVKVGVFVNAPEEYVRQVTQLVGLDKLQFHGDETPYYCEQFATPHWKAFRLESEKTLALMSHFRPEYFLIDAHVEKIWGGSGVTANWDLAAAAKKLGRLILAGGLNVRNIEAAIATVKPDGIDVNSGVEDAPGQKNRFKLEEFLRKVRESI